MADDLPDPCPSCGATRPASSLGGPCPRCRVGPEPDDESPTVWQAEEIGTTIDRSGPEGVLEVLAASVGPVPRVLLRDTDTGAEPPVFRPSSPEMPEPGDRPPRLRLLGEIARGGMGAVLKGRDEDLGRDLAVKVLLEKHRDDPELVRRFVEEAQIGGQLQHPGVVPIYELGTFADRRPYFSMKLVKGQTLAGLLAARPSPAEGLPRFLGIFEHVCQTVAYAHARGVIHRDLKPSNVMVGAFGEVQVMDWGLAKVLRRGGAEDDVRAGRPAEPETVVATARSSGGADSDQSRAGSAMGTPSYMAPEQARGEVEAIDERADVFALGSILCELLTGRPAFVGRSQGEILRKAARGETADALARLAAGGIDDGLVGLARACLEAEAEDRPRDAGAVSERVAAHLAGVQERLRKAELASVEERARRRMTTVAAAAAVVLIAAGAGGLAWARSQRAGRVERTTRAVDGALADASRLAGEANGERGDPVKWAAALDAARRAEGLLAQGEADEPLRRRVAGRVAELEARRHEVEADRKFLDILEAIRAEAGRAGDLRRTDVAYAAAFRAAGLDIDSVDPSAAGKWVRGRTAPDELIAYLDDWIWARDKASRPEAAWRRLVDAARSADDDPWRDALRAKLAARDETAAAVFHALADDARSLDAQPAASLLLLARQLTNVGDAVRAEAVLRRAWRRFPGDFWVNIGLADVPGQGAGTPQQLYPRATEAVRFLTAAVAIRPDSALARGELGWALIASGDRAGAVAECREAVRLAPDSASTRVWLGYALNVSGDLDGAEAAFREAMLLDQEDAWGPANLAAVLRQKKDPAGALAALRQAIELAPGLARFRLELGDTLREAGDRPGATEAYREATRLQPDYAEAYSKLGFELYESRDPAGAARAYAEAARLEPRYARHHMNLSVNLLQLGDTAGAVAEGARAVELDPGYAHARFILANALTDAGDLAGAAASYREAARIRADFAEAYCNLSRVLRRQGEFAGALLAIREGHKFGTKQPDWPYPSAQWLAQCERFARLADRLPEVLGGRAEPADNAERLDFATMAVETRRFAAAARLEGEALAADPKLAADPRRVHRYNAACAAALAGCGQGKDDPKPDDSARDALRLRALGWLRDDLDSWAKLLESDPKAAATTAQRLRFWRTDPDLAGVRDPEALAKLPEAERADWRNLWDELDRLLKSAEAKSKK